MKCAGSFLVMLVGVSLLGLIAGAAPVYQQIVTLRQPNGTSFQAIPFGDEWANGLRTRNGHLITRDTLTQHWVYARPRDGRLEPTGRVVGRDSPPLESLQALGTSNQAQERRRTAPRTRVVGPTAVGSQPVLVILIAFKDQGPVGTTPQEWAEKIFGATNSVRDYYREVSYGQLELVPATESHETENDGIVGWLTLDQDHPNMGGNLGSATEDLAQTALNAADAFVDFASFDTNADGAISNNELHIVIVAAGYDTAYGGETSCSPSLWAHHTSFLLAVPAFDGVKIGDALRGGGYIEIGEWHCSQEDTPGHPATIGVLVHEFGHDLGRGAPDLYDSDGSSYGIGKWCVMATGAWNSIDSPGDTPAHPSAWVKAYFGWITPELVRTGERQLTLAPAAEQGQVVQLLENPGGIDWNWGINALGEYLLLEHRKKLGYDAALPGEGLLIWYIDESQPDNDYESRRLVDLLEADGQNNLKCRGGPNCNKGDAGDPFPGATGNRAFGDQTTPNSRLRNGFATGIELTNIALAGDRASARLRIIQRSPGNLVLLSDSFDDGPNGEWTATEPWALRAAGECQQAPPSTTGQHWYYGTSQSCQYTVVGGRLSSPVIAIPPGVRRLTVKFSTLVQLQPGDHAEIRAYFNGDRERLIFRRRATKGWVNSAVRVLVPRGASEMQLEFTVRSRGSGRARQSTPLGWWIDNIEVRTEASRTGRSDSFSPVHNELSVIETRMHGDGTLQVLARQPAQEMQLTVYDVTGRLVATAASPGSELLYAGRDERGQRLANGVYLYVVTVRGFDDQVIQSEIRKLVILR